MPATMPNPDKSKANGKAEYVPAKYVKCDLTVGQKTLLKAYRDEVELIDVMKWLDDRIVEGHTLSLKLESSTQMSATYLCNLTGVRTTQGTHDNICLNSRGSTPTNALIATMYKDAEMLHGDWSNTEVLKEVDL